MDSGIENVAGSASGAGNGYSRPDTIWLELVVAAGYRGEALPPAREVAELLNRRANPAFSPSDLFHYLYELAGSATGEEPGNNPTRLSDLVAQLAPTILGAGIAASSVHAQTKRLLLRSLDVVGAAGALALARTAAAAFGRPLSPRLDALMQKLARSVESIPEADRRPAQHALRDLVKAMVEVWAGATVSFSVSGYDLLFAEQTDAQPERSWNSQLGVTPERVIATSFEVGALGGVVWNAVNELGQTEEGVRQIMEMVKRAPADSNSVNVVAQQFANPTRLIALLRESPVDFAAVDAIVIRLKDAAGPPLIDALIQSEQREVRTGLLKRIATLGSGVCTLASERLQNDDRWFVQRNMLRVIREVNCELDPKVIDRYMQHADARVREEAVQILLNNPIERDRALAAALRDPDLNVMKIGLKAARQSAPEGVMPFIAKRIQEPGFPSELRMASIRVLARSNSVLALEPLLRFVVGGSTLLGKPKLAAKSPEMLVALDGLARMWSHERRAAAMLVIARASNDPEILQAAEGKAGSAADEALEDAN